MAEIRVSSWPRLVRLRESTWDFLRLIDEKGREDKVFLLAGGIAFNLLLAVIPLLLLVILGAAFFLHRSQQDSINDILQALNQFIPATPATAGTISKLIADVLSSAAATATVGTLAFAWFATRLFGSLRLVLADVFDIEETRDVIRAKLFDMRMSLISSLFIVAYLAATTYVEVASSRGTEALRSIGVTDVSVTLGRTVAFLFIFLTFLLLYRYLPNKKVRWRTAIAAALFAAVALEVAKAIFAQVANSINPGSMYSGTIAAVVFVIFWLYYVALIFILGGEVAQVTDLSRVRRMQRVVFE